ncbi:biotin--[acetyl-CoA-carboxylase] ligase [Pseudobowmanella zhangzhouensis]|uniref:biotin--[acetyl-CoA-carboxylase] ligase n=1 Tax=Pseudobowmanella zhangzhouensis TaxID=1537679 RepID=UPI0036109147
MSARGEQVRSEIIHILADGAFHSGQQLGERLAISRVAIAKHVATLAQLGLEVHSLTGKGYRLAHPLTLLDEQHIKHHLHRPDTPLNLHHVVGSTNDIIKQQIGHWPSGAVCLAEAQTAGRGRQGKSWLSPFASSLYLSMYWNFTLGYQQISGLSLVVGVAIASTLKRLNINNVGLKWPNDVYVNGKKIAACWWNWRDKSAESVTLLSVPASIFGYLSRPSKSISRGRMWRMNCRVRLTAISFVPISLTNYSVV